MITPFLYLGIQSLFLWFLVIFLHRQKNRFTLIPLYAYIAILTIFTHNLSDLGFAVTVNQWYFLIGSVSFFTTLMLCMLFLYLFEGPRATRLALLIVLGASSFYIGIVFLLNMQVDTSKWIVITSERMWVYFWSIFAIILDGFFIAIFWEILEKTKKPSIFIRVFLVIFGTYLLDTLIFTTGVFGAQTIYASVLQGNLMTRLLLALVITPIISISLRREGYIEEKREKPKNVWEILNFRSDLETKIETMEDGIKIQKVLQERLKESQETYYLALEGANAGIWDWDIEKNYIMYSAKFSSLLGFEKGELSTTIENFKKILHPDDVERTFTLIDECFKTRKIYSIEYRLKTKDKSYKWYQCGGIVKFNSTDKPIRMVGSIIDIDEKKHLLESYKEKVDQLEQLNSLMVGRELQMFELKEQIKKLGKT